MLCSFLSIIVHFGFYFDKLKILTHFFIPAPYEYISHWICSPHHFMFARTLFHIKLTLTNWIAFIHICTKKRSCTSTRYNAFFFVLKHPTPVFVHHPTPSVYVSSNYCTRNEVCAPMHVPFCGPIYNIIKKFANAFYDYDHNCSSFLQFPCYYVL